MNAKDATDRLLMIARDRLRNRPGAFNQFQFTLQTTAQGMALIAGAQAIPYAYEIGEEMGSPKAAELIREHLTSIVDFWAKSQPLPPAVDALPGAAPLPMTDARETANRADTVQTPHKAKEKLKCRTWWDVASPYIVEVIQTGQYATAKQLYHALEAKAGPDSPFDKGTRDNRGSLFVREIAKSLSLKTTQNKWRKLRELAQK